MKVTRKVVKAADSLTIDCFKAGDPFIFNDQVWLRTPDGAVSLFTGVVYSRGQFINSGVSTFKALPNAEFVTNEEKS